MAGVTRTTVTAGPPGSYQLKGAWNAGSGRGWFLPWWLLEAPLIMHQGLGVMMPVPVSAFAVGGKCVVLEKIAMAVFRPCLHELALLEAAMVGACAWKSLSWDQRPWC